MTQLPINKLSSASNTVTIEETVSQLVSSQTDTFEQTFNDTLYASFDDGYYIGMMSGTSLDGLDAVICQFNNASETKSASDKIIATHSAAFPEQLRNVLLALCLPNGTNDLAMPAKNLVLQQQPQSELEWFGWASREYAEFASLIVNKLLEKSGIDADSILAIGCHGQTVRHRPLLGFSLQLVDPNIIAERTGISVVSDFRRRDMAVGGQGAPLAPAFHLAQFEQSALADETQNLVIVNLGGIANITILPVNQSDQVIGYDTGPANTLLDSWYQFHVKHSGLIEQHPTYESLYDKTGQWAKTGNVNNDLLEELLKHPYFEELPPKSTGREDFNLQWLKAALSQLQTTDTPIAPEDVQATLTALTVQTLSNAINEQTKRLDLLSGKVIVCGGGAFNSYLIEELTAALPQWHVVTSDVYGIAPTWVEAMAFAWLAKQTIMGEAGNLPAVTGARKPVILGQVCFA